MAANSIDLRDFIRDVPDFPKPGILFRDITPLLKSPDALNAAVDALAAPFMEEQIDVIAAPEARGFLFAIPLATRLGTGFVPIRKPGKLPYDSHSLTYELEYGSDTLEMHVDAVKEGDRVLVLDDLLATGGTIAACCEMIENNQAEIVGCSFLIHLLALGGGNRLADYKVHSLIEY